MGMSLASDSPSSAAGSDPATIPQPANSRARRGSAGSSRAHRNAMPHSPSPCGVHPPDGPGVAVAVHALELVDERGRGRRRRAADRGRRVQRGGELEAGAAVGQHAGDVGREVHDVGQVQHERGLGHVRRRAVRRQRLRRRSARRTRAPRGPCWSGPAGAASARSRASSPLRRMVPASTREVTRPFSRPHQHLGGGADKTVDAERPAAGVARREPPQQPPRVELVLARASRSRASTTFSTSPRSIRPIAVATTRSHVGAGAGAVRVGRPRRAAWEAPASVASQARERGSPRAALVTVVTHQRPPRAPTTTSGTTSTPPAAERGEKANEPKATGPVPGSPTSSRTTACRFSSAQANSASSKRVGPSVSIRAALPQPTRPSPRRTQASAPARGRSDSSGPGSASGTVRATKGRAGTRLPAGGGHRSPL